MKKKKQFRILHITICIYEPLNLIVHDQFFSCKAKPDKAIRITLFSRMYLFIVK